MNAIGVLLYLIEDSKKATTQVALVLIVFV